jgi:hypothetical protein
MDFLNHSREFFRQALGEALRNHIPDGARIPIVLALLLRGARYTIAPGLFRPRSFRRCESRGLLAADEYDDNLYSGAWVF